MFTALQCVNRVIVPGLIRDWLGIYFKCLILPSTTVEQRAWIFGVFWQPWYLRCHRSDVTITISYCSTTPSRKHSLLPSNFYIGQFTSLNVPWCLLEYLMCHMKWSFNLVLLSEHIVIKCFCLPHGKTHLICNLPPIFLMHAVQTYELISCNHWYKLLCCLSG